MGIWALEIMVGWSLVALLTGLALGAIISKGERIHKEEFLGALFAILEALQASRWTERQTRTLNGQGN